jgi:hypothetical protein
MFGCRQKNLRRRVKIFILMIENERLAGLPEQIFKTRSAGNPSRLFSQANGAEISAGAAFGERSKSFINAASPTPEKLILLPNYDKVEK